MSKHRFSIFTQIYLNQTGPLIAMKLLAYFIGLPPIGPSVGRDARES